MEVVVKPSEASEVDAIFALRLDPDILLQQHWPGFFDTPAAFVNKLDRGPNWLGMTFRCSSIYADGQLVGHVMQHYRHRRDGRRLTLECGWNLAKTHWGLGIMPRTLSQLFAQLFETTPRLIIHASCYATNQRSRRVMEKLGFQPDPMGWIVWCMHQIRGRGRRVVQFRLDRRLFQAASCHRR